MIQLRGNLDFLKNKFITLTTFLKKTFQSFLLKTKRSEGLNGGDGEYLSWYYFASLNWMAFQFYLTYLMIVSTFLFVKKRLYLWLLPVTVERPHVDRDVHAVGWGEGLRGFVPPYLGWHWWGSTNHLYLCLPNHFHNGCRK